MSLRVNAEQFGAANNEFLKRRVFKASQDKLRNLAAQIFAKIVYRTPIDTGHAQGAWELTIDGPGKGISEGEAVTRGAIGAILVALETLKNVKRFTTEINITNSARHILILEDGGFVPPNPGPSSDPRPERFGRILVSGGYSVQAPQGMVKITLQEAKNA